MGFGFRIRQAQIADPPEKLAGQEKAIRLEHRRAFRYLLRYRLWLSSFMP